MKIALAGCLLVLASSIYAQDGGEQYACNFVGGRVPEPFGEGLSLHVNEFNCKLETGSLAGGILTGTQVYEFKGPNGRLLVGSGVFRYPGYTYIFQNLEGTTAVAMKDGKPVGAAGAGKGIIKAAAGKGKEEHDGKTYIYSVKTTGPASFVINLTYDK